MRPNQDDFDEEIRGHIAISVKQRIERGEDPETARLAALREFGNVTLTRDSMRGVWHSRWFDSADLTELTPPGRFTQSSGPTGHTVDGMNWPAPSLRNSHTLVAQFPA